MSDYDKMSVEELIGVAADYRGMAVTMDRFVIPALRRAVLREATVGEVKVVTTEHFDEIARPEDTERIVTMSEQIISKTWVPEGEYVLCKKEGGTTVRIEAKEGK